MIHPPPTTVIEAAKRERYNYKTKINCFFGEGDFWNGVRLTFVWLHILFEVDSTGIVQINNWVHQNLLLIIQVCTLIRKELFGRFKSFIEFYNYWYGEFCDIKLNQLLTWSSTLLHLISFLTFWIISMNVLFILNKPNTFNQLLCYY